MRYSAHVAGFQRLGLAYSTSRSRTDCGMRTEMRAVFAIRTYYRRAAAAGYYCLRWRPMSTLDTLIADGYTCEMTIQTFTSPKGEAMVAMTRDEYEDLVDARDHALTVREIDAGTTPMVRDEDVDAYLAAPTPLAFWRKHRGLTQVELSQAADISQPYLAQLENGQREGAVSVYARLAKLLNVRIDGPAVVSFR